MESKFPASLFVEGGVEAVDEEMVRSWAGRFSQAIIIHRGSKGRFARSSKLPVQSREQDSGPVEEALPVGAG